MARRPFGSCRPLDPRRVNVLFDSNAFDVIDANQADVDRLRELARLGKITLVAPWSVRAELQDPRTPAVIQEAVSPQFFTCLVGQTDGEQALYRHVREILQGNASPGKHDADARHVAEAAKYGGYFITHDRRINRTKRMSLSAILPPSLRIVTLAEFLAIFDNYETGQFA